MNWIYHKMIIYGLPCSFLIRRPDTGAPEDTDTGTLGMTQERPGTSIFNTAPHPSSLYPYYTSFLPPISCRPSFDPPPPGNPRHIQEH